jgi:hypothetical protein
MAICRGHLHSLACSRDTMAAIGTRLAVGTGQAVLRVTVSTKAAVGTTSDGWTQKIAPARRGNGVKLCLWPDHRPSSWDLCRRLGRWHMNF